MYAERGGEVALWVSLGDSVGVRLKGFGVIGATVKDFMLVDKTRV